MGILIIQIGLSAFALYLSIKWIEIILDFVHENKNRKKRKAVKIKPLGIKVDVKKSIKPIKIKKTGKKGRR